MVSLERIVNGLGKCVVGASLVSASFLGCEKEPVGPEPVEPVAPVDSIPSVPVDSIPSVPVDSIPSVPVVDSVRLKGVVSNEPFLKYGPTPLIWTLS